MRRVQTLSAQPSVRRSRFFQRSTNGSARAEIHAVTLFIATGSFFLGQAKVFPQPIRIYPLLAIPPLIVIVSLFYWLWRVRLRQSLRGMVLVGTPARANS